MKDLKDLKDSWLWRWGLDFLGGLLAGGIVTVALWFALQRAEGG